jgi:hypothetical protein
MISGIKGTKKNNNESMMGGRISGRVTEAG